MLWLDLILLIVLILFAAGGYEEGFLLQLSNLLGLLIGTFAAARLYAPLAAALAPSLELLILLEPIIFMGILLLVWGLVSLPARMLEAEEESEKEAPLDRLAGALVGLASGAVIIYALTLAMLEFDMTLGHRVAEARVGDFCLRLGERILAPLLS